jgi:type IV pilus assembly protein PilB
MVVTAEIRRRIIRTEAATRLKRFAVTQGMRTLRMDGFEKCLLGQTTFDEVYNAVGSED